MYIQTYFIGLELSFLIFLWFYSFNITKELQKIAKELQKTCYYWSGMNIFPKLFKLE